jgi:hypothetical protein
MTKANEYVNIARWGQMMGSFRYFIEAQQEKAASDGAPIDAIYEKDGVWHTLGEMGKGGFAHNYFAARGWL